jgi:hypothetical protein
LDSREKAQEAQKKNRQASFSGLQCVTLNASASSQAPSPHLLLWQKNVGQKNTVSDSGIETPPALICCGGTWAVDPPLEKSPLEAVAANLAFSESHF